MAISRQAVLARDGRLHQNVNQNHFDFGHLGNIFRQKLFFDVILEVENREIAAHKVVLSSCSVYMYWKLNREAGRGHMNRVKMLGISYDTLSTIIEYFYTSKVFLTLDNVEGLLGAAFALALTDLQEACRKFLQDVMGIDNCLHVAYLARKYECQDLLTIANEYIGENFEEVVKSAGFMNISYDRVRDLIVKEAVNVDEEDILNCVLAWVTKDLENRQQYVVSLLKCIPFPLISSNSAIKVLENEEWLKSDVQYNLFLADVLRNRVFEEHNTLRRTRKPAQCLVVVGRKIDAHLHVEIYDFRKQIWCNGLHPANTKKYIHGNALAISGFNIYYGNCSVQTIDVTDPHGMWLECATTMVPHTRTDFLEQLDAIFLVSHVNVTYGTEVNVALKVSMYNKVSGKLSELPSMSTKRISPGYAIRKGKLYMVGGYHNNELLKSVECYDPAINLWFEIPDMIQARSSPGVAAMEDKLFVAGGYYERKCLKQVEVFDLKTSSWQPLRDMNIARGGAPGVIFVNNFVYVIGGTDDNYEIINSVEVYDFQTNVWSMLDKSMSTGKFMVAVTLMNKADLKRLPN